MKYVFLGSPRFAEIILEALIRAGLPPAAVVCNPDRPVGRKKIMTAPLAKQLAGRHDIPVFQPDDLASIHDALANLSAEFFIVAAYAKIIPKATLGIPRLGTLGVHPSLLPKYRGASPIQSVILHGETETGTTIYQMDEKMDHGGIFAQTALALDPLATNYAELEEQLAQLSAALLIKTVPEIIKGALRAQPQDEQQATFTKKFKTEDGFIDSAVLDAAEHGDARQAKQVICKINALNPEPGAWTLRNGKRVKLLKATLINGALKLISIQNEGEKPRAL